MKTTISIFRKVGIVLLFFLFSIQFIFSQIDADISLMSVSPSTGPYSYGQKIYYNFRVTNNSDSPNDITRIILRDELPAGLEFNQVDNSLTGTELGGNVIEFASDDLISYSGGTMDYAIVLTVVSCDGGFNSWQNKIELYQYFNGFVESSLEDPDNHVNSDTDFFLHKIDIFDLALTNSHSDPYPHYYTETIQFELKVFNQGSIAAKNVEVTDYIPDGYYFDVSLNPGWIFDPVTKIGSYIISNIINPGESFSIFINLKLKDSYGPGDDWENAAEISSAMDSSDNNQTGNDIDSSNDKIRNNDPGLDVDDFIGGDGKNGPGNGYLRIEDDADLASVSIFDLALRKTVITPAPYSYDENITFKIEVFNQGNQIARSIVIRDFISPGYTMDPGLNPGWNYAGDYATYVFIGELNPDNSATVNVTLTLLRTDGSYENWINYAAIISAGSPSGLNIDADSYPGSSSPHEFEVVPGDSNDDVITGQYINEGEDEDDSDVAGIDIFDLAMRKTITTVAPTFDYGQTIEFLVEILNQGNLDAKNIIIEEEAIPCGFQFDIAANPGWIYDSITRSARYIHTDVLTPGNIVFLYVKMKVLDCHDPNYLLSWKNSSEIVSAQNISGITFTSDIDSEYDNNRDNDLVVDNALQLSIEEDDDDHDIAVARIPDLALKIKADNRGPFNPGQIATFTITVYNQGNERLKNIKVFDTLSPGYAFILGATNPGWTIINPAKVSYTYLNTLAPRDSFTVKLKLTVLSSTNPLAYIHYAEIAQALTLNNLILNDDADCIFNSNSAYERAVVVGHPWDNNVLGIGYNRIPHEDMDDHDPASIDTGGSVGNYVWNDKNGNGLQDSGEPGLPNVIVELRNCNTSLNIPVRYDTTNALGYYLFEFVAPGTYYVKFRLPGAYKFTLGNQSPNDLIDSDVDGDNGYGTTECFPVTEMRLDIDAGAYICIPVGDLVWLDDNKNNLYDLNENGVNGLKVELYRYTNGNWIFWDFDYTGISPYSICGDGYYNFCPNPGTYYLKFVTPPYGLVPAKANVGFNDNIDSDITKKYGPGTTDNFTLISGGSANLTIDAGYYGMAQVANSLAWIDNNSNGNRDSGEPGLANMPVEIYNYEGDLFSTTSTDANGNYNLSYLQADDYFVKFVVPAPYSQSFVFTNSNQGEPEYDSDVTHAYGYGTTDLFQLIPEEILKNLDAGIKEGTLPINYISLGAKWRIDHTDVYWTTANETNVEKFVIQRSFDSPNKFVSVGEVEAKNKNSNLYSFNDRGDFIEGVYYYRILEVDHYGQSIKSNVVAVFADHKNDSGNYTIYPNPVAVNAYVRINLAESSDIRLDLLDLNGKIVIPEIVDETIEPGVKEIEFSVSELRPATYLLRVHNGDKIEFKEVIVIKK